MTFRGQATFSIGAALRAERERASISLDAVERGTMIRRDFLELIDADRLEELPSGAYAKGFIRAYAAYVGLDATPLVKLYDDRHAPATSELANVVGRPVRVPPDRQRRTWKIAVGTAAAALVLLGALGVFRSDSKPEPLPKVSKAAARVVTESDAPNPLGATVRIDVIGDATWIEAWSDGQPVFGQTLVRGQSRTFKGTDRLEVFIARAGEVRIMANGRDLQTPNAPSYRGEFTPATSDLPANEWTAAPVADTPPANSGTATLREQPNK
jgi:cytoskeleton protein RodZ